MILTDLSPTEGAFWTKRNRPLGSQFVLPAPDGVTAIQFLTVHPGPPCLLRDGLADGGSTGGSGSSGTASGCSAATQVAAGRKPKKPRLSNLGDDFSLHFQCLLCNCANKISDNFANVSDVRSHCCSQTHQRGMQVMLGLIMVLQ